MQTLLCQHAAPIAERLRGEAGALSDAAAVRAAALGALRAVLPMIAEEAVGEIVPHVLPLLPAEVQTLREATFSEVRALGTQLDRLAAGSAADGDDGAAAPGAGAANGGGGGGGGGGAAEEQDFDAMVRATMKKKEAAEKARKAGGGAPLKKSSGAKQEEAAQRKQQAELAAVERLRGALSRLDRLAGPSPNPDPSRKTHPTPYRSNLYPNPHPNPRQARRAAGHHLRRRRRRRRAARRRAARLRPPAALAARRAGRWWRWRARARVGREPL